MTKRFTLLALLFAVLAIPAAGAQTPIKQAERDEISMMATADPAMERAFGKARSTLDNFLRMAAAPAKGTSDYSVKVGVTDGKNTEYFWVRDFERHGEKFVGTLANEPRMVKKFKNGQRFDFSKNLIVDWTYIDASKRKMFGNFTACALLTKEAPEEASKFRERFGLDCD
ncbi:Uncharacterized conserved protein YegJ, DUF2314 family [Duganella sp. CF458]|uniref:YegJ family protein n=1 Tax=Duganella sp. CF458 TaxID=1884368 RepID=UPI0008EF2052|nr:DUF2314 domain-containing protein [Duganella sp. CF458]SFG85084.1 Uncharacterized conserved protein YegJ, DUF2314 family [Duganella sp. CF458]